MGEIRCGEPDCGEVASFESIVEMANLTGGMLGGLFSNSRTYKCPSGHVTTRRSAFSRLQSLLARKRTHRSTETEGDTSQGSPAQTE